jgi:hypothetical protein
LPCSVELSKAQILATRQFFIRHYLIHISVQEPLISSSSSTGRSRWNHGPVTSGGHRRVGGVSDLLAQTLSAKLATDNKKWNTFIPFTFWPSAIPFDESFTFLQQLVTDNTGRVSVWIQIARGKKRFGSVACWQGVPTASKSQRAKDPVFRWERKPSEEERGRFESGGVSC